MTYRFAGPQGYSGPKDGAKNKGVMRAHREKLRIDAELRDEELPQDSPKRRRNRLVQADYELAV